MKLSQTNGPILHFYDGNERASFEHLKKAGFKYVDISFWSRYLSGSRYFTESNDKLADEYKRILDELELIPVQSHEPFGNSIGDDNGAFYFRKTPLSIDLAGKIGIPSITVHAGIAITPMSREEFMEKNVAVFKKLIPYAEKYGTRILIENTGWKVNGTNLSTADDLNEIIDRLDHPLFGVCWDTGHANLCGLDQYAELKKLGSRLEGLHVHDNYGKRAPGCDLHQYPYWGNVNFDGVISALLEIGYKGTFNFEVDNPVRRTEAIPFIKDGTEQKKLEMMSHELRLQMETFLFAIGKQMLEKYDCFEEN